MYVIGCTLFRREDMTVENWDTSRIPYCDDHLCLWCNLSSGFDEKEPTS